MDTHTRVRTHVHANLPGMITAVSLLIWRRHRVIWIINRPPGAGAHPPAVIIFPSTLGWHSASHSTSLLMKSRSDKGKIKNSPERIQWERKGGKSGSLVPSRHPPLPLSRSGGDSASTLSDWLAGRFFRGCVLGLSLLYQVAFKMHGLLNL